MALIRTERNARSFGPPIGLGTVTPSFSQSPLFDPEEGDRRKEEAIELVEEHAAPDWNDEVDRAIRRVAARSDRFTSDDVWAELLGTSTAWTHEPRAMGAAMRRAAVAGLCSPTTEFWLSKRPERHRAPLRVWSSIRQAEAS